MPDALVEAVGVEKRYGGESPVTALAAATCTISAGDRIALVGASGSGKSTLLYLLAGLELPTSGAVRWPALGPSARLFPSFAGFVFQNVHLLDPLTAAENVAIPLLLKRMVESNAMRIARESLDRFGLAALADKLPQELSGGQAQRVGIARAIAHEPSIVFADEPTGQLDHPTAMLVIDRLQAAADASRTALLVATHDETIASRFAWRWRMHHGVLEIER